VRLFSAAGKEVPVRRSGRALALLLPTVAALVLSGVAAAAKPVKTPAPSPEFFTVSGSCSFDVIVHTTAQNEQQITFGDGSFLITGKLKADLINAETNKTISVNIPGPGRYVPGDDGSLTLTWSGPWFFFLPGGAFLTNGHGTLFFGADGSATFTQQGGKSEDLCAALS
jgi:hypothetical protein